MIDSFNNMFYFTVFVIGCIITPGIYAIQLWESKYIFKRYNIDESATLVQRFAAAWPTAESLTGILIVIFGPQGNWAFFTLGLIVFIANLIYNTAAYFNLAFTLGRDKYKVSPEAMLASIFKVTVYSILIWGLQDKIFY